MKKTTISVIIPAYQSAKTIGRALDSLLGQTRPPDEILIVNDGSTDRLVTALKPYRGRVTLISKPNGGAASARNLGLERASGDLIAFLDADDTWEPEKLERQLRILAEHPEVGLVAGRFYEQEPGRPRVVAQHEEPDYMGRALAADGAEIMEIATRVWTSTVLVRRAALGPHRFVSGLEPAEDRDLWFRVIAENPVYLSTDLLATQVLTPGSLSRSSLDVDCGNMLRVVRRHAGELGARGLRAWEAQCYRRWAGNHLAQGRPRESLAPAWSRLRLEPFSAEAWWVVLKAIWEIGTLEPSHSPILSGGPQ